LCDTFTDDAGNEKTLRYKVLLYADSLTQCGERILSFAKQGYDMAVESIRQTDMILL